MAVKVPAGRGSLSLMTLADLVRSSVNIVSKHGKHGYGMNQAIQKEFGTVYYNNKTVIYNEQSHILEIRMGIGTKTEKAYKGMHSIRMAIYGVEGTIYDSLEELYLDKTGKVADTEDIRDMKKAIRGVTTTTLNRKLNDEERERLEDVGREANKFSLVYDLDPNAQLSGYIIPVASIDPDSGAYTFGDSGKIFYMEKPININSFVRVSCSCSSYFFTCAWYNYQAGAHLGQQPASYPKKTGYSETVLNMKKSPGMCKHLMMFTMLLLNGGIINKADTKGFHFNMQALRNRSEKLTVPRKLADSGDWGKHLRQLQNSLRNADKRRIDKYSMTPNSAYDEWKKSTVAKNSVTFSKAMNARKGVNKDVYVSNAPTQDWADQLAGVDDYTKELLKPTVNKVLDLFRHYK